MRYPEWSVPFLRKVKYYFINDSGAFFILAMTFIGQGISIYPSFPAFVTHPFETLIPDPILTVAWSFLAVLCFIASFTTRSIFTATIFGLSTAVLTVWGVGFLLSHDFFMLNLGAMYIGLMLMSVFAVYRGRSSEIKLFTREP